MRPVVFRCGFRGFVRAGILNTEQNEDHEGPQEMSAGWDVCRRCGQSAEHRCRDDDCITSAFACPAAESSRSMKRGKVSQPRDMKCSNGQTLCEGGSALCETWGSNMATALVTG